MRKNKGICLKGRFKTIFCGIKTSRAEQGEKPGTDGKIGFPPKNRQAGKPSVLISANGKMQTGGKCRFSDLVKGRFTLTVFTALMLLSVIMVFSGCSPVKSLKNRVVVQGIAVDTDELGGYDITIQVYRPGNAESSDRDSTLHRTHADTISSALESIEKTTGSKPLYAEVKIILLGEDVINEGLYKILSFFLRDSRISEDVTVLAVRGGTAGEMLKVKAGETATSQNIYDIVKMSSRNKSSTPGELIDIGNRLYGEGDAYMQLIEKRQDANGESLYAVGVLLFSKGYPTGLLENDESKAFMWMNGFYIHDTVDIEYSDATFTFRIENVSKSLSTELDGNNQPAFHFSFSAECELLEISSAENRLYSGDDTEKLENMLCRYIEESAESAVNSAVINASSDVFNLLKALKFSEPDFYKGLDDPSKILACSNYTFSASARIKRIGIKNNPT